MAKQCFDHLCTPVDGNMEGFHNAVHVFIGGTMNNAGCSPSDPVFWLHHANVDCLWEQYRQEVQDPAKRTLEYPLTEFASPSNAYFFCLLFCLQHVCGMSLKYLFSFIFTFPCSIVKCLTSSQKNVDILKS